MTFPDYLAALKRSNPKLFAARLFEIKPDVFADQLRRAYEAGANHASVGGGNLFDEIFPTLHKKGKP